MPKKNPEPSKPPSQLFSQDFEGTVSRLGEVSAQALDKQDAGSYLEFYGFERIFLTR